MINLFATWPVLLTTIIIYGLVIWMLVYFVRSIARIGYALERIASALEKSERS